MKLETVMRSMERIDLGEGRFHRQDALGDATTLGALLRAFEDEGAGAITELQLFLETHDDRVVVCVYVGDADQLKAYAATWFPLFVLTKQLNRALAGALIAHLRGQLAAS